MCDAESQYGWLPYEIIDLLNWKHPGAVNEDLKIVRLTVQDVGQLRHHFLANRKNTAQLDMFAEEDEIPF